MKYIKTFEDRGYYYEKPVSEQNFENFKNDVEKIFESNNWIVIKPKSFEAFSYYGQDQEWSDVKYGCKYNFNQNIYINIDKEDNTKFVLNFDRGDFYGEDDEVIYLRDFLDENYELFNVYGEILNCDNIVKDGNDYWIVVDGYEDFAQYFKYNRDLNEKFVKAILSGEGFEFFEYGYNDFDFADSYLDVDEDNLLLLKVVLMLEKFDNDYDYDFEEIENYKDVCSIIKEYDLKELKIRLKMAIRDANESADQSAAYEDLTDEVYSFFNLKMGSAKWENYKNSKYSKLFIKFKSREDAYRAKFIINKYDDSYEDDVIEYSPPYYGYSGDLKEKQEIFDNELPERLDEYENDNIDGERINKYFDTWKKVKESHPDFSDNQIIEEIEIILNSEKYNL